MMADKRIKDVLLEGEFAAFAIRNYKNQEKIKEKEC